LTDISTPAKNIQEVKKLSLHNQEVGFMGQDKARQYLEEKDYSIVAENFRCRLGEIDLIATRDNVLVFLEVKTDLTGFFGEAEARVDLRKQRRIKRAALFFLAENKFHYHRDWEYRFDVIVIEKETSLDHKNHINHKKHKNHKNLRDSSDERNTSFQLNKLKQMNLNLRHIQNAF